MKNRSTGFFCVSLLLICGATAVHARQSDNDPPANPQTPAQQAPPSQQASPSPQSDTSQPTVGTPKVQAAPELPKYPDVRLPGEYGFWIGVNGWVPRGQPFVNKGMASVDPQNGRFTMQGHPKEAEGAEVGLAMGLHNALRFSYFRTRASGDFTTASDTTIPGMVYPAGTLVATDYLLQSYKLSFDYLTWPYPVESRRFRLMTLWQFEYMTIRHGFDAPLVPTTDSNGNPYVDSSGNPISYAVQVNKKIMTPMFGLAAHEYFSKHVRLDLSGSGFAVPHHWTIWDVQGTVNIRLRQFEIGFGGKAFHYKTSPQADLYTHNTLFAPFASFTWFSQ